jgi:hypothetical protein
VKNKPGMPCADKRADYETQFKNSRIQEFRRRLGRR